MQQRWYRKAVSTQGCLLVAATIAALVTASCASGSLDDLATDDSRHAATIDNGITLNGITLNGITLNGITLNGITLNGITLNGITLNGITLNGITLNGVALDGLYINGIGLNGVGLDGIGLSEVGTSGVGTYGIALDGIGLETRTLGAIGTSGEGTPGAGLRGISVNGLYLDGGGAYGVDVGGHGLIDVALRGIGSHNLQVNGTGPWGIGLGNGTQQADGLGNLTLNGRLPRHVGLKATGRPGFGLRGTGLNGLFLAGDHANTLIVNGQSLLDVGLSALAIDRLDANGVQVRNASGHATGLTTRQVHDLEAMLFHLVGCALPTGEGLTITIADGTPRTYEGLRGLAPEWADGAIGQTGEERVRACIDSSAGAYESTPFTRAHEQILETTLFHLVGCALPAGDAITVIAADGTPRTYEGLRGLAPEWADGAISQAGQERVRACIESTPDAVSGLALNAQQEADMQLLLSYMVQCALPASESVTIYAADGTPVVYPGALGLAPEWATSPLSADGELLVSACLAARSNASGQTVQISLRGGGLHTTPVERAIYRHHEGAFWGNFFAGESRMYTCSVSGADISGRSCTGDACGFEHVGSCAEVCDTKDAVDGHYSGCAGESAVINTFLNITEHQESGQDHSCIVTDDTLWCWGDNSDGELGDGTFRSSATPIAVTRLGKTVAEVGGGANHTCARALDGSAWCWGSNEHGAVGSGSTMAKHRYPTHVSSLGYDVASLGVAASHACALTTAGAMLCWGDNFFGQLGNGTTAAQSVPVQVAALGSNVARIAMGESAQHTCAMTNDGTPWCWGWNSAGQLGNGSLTDDSAPVQVAHTDDGQAFGEVTDMCTGWLHTCARKADGTTWCWGSNASGQLGSSALDATVKTRPVQVDLAGEATPGTLSCGASHTCVALRDGSLQCWGNNEHGQLGNGDLTVSTSSTPIQVTSLTDTVTRVSADASRTCTTLRDGSRWCWGDDPAGMLFGETGTNTTSVQVEIPEEHRYAPAGLELELIPSGSQVLRWSPHLAQDLEGFEIYQDGLLLANVPGDRVRWEQDSASSACYEMRALFTDGTVSSLSPLACNPLQ